jgi:hypothetical protein
MWNVSTGRYSNYSARTLIGWMFHLFSDKVGVCSVNTLRGDLYRADIVREVYRVSGSKSFECNVTVTGHVKPYSLVDRCKGIGEHCRIPLCLLLFM